MLMGFCLVFRSRGESVVVFLCCWSDDSLIAVADWEGAAASDTLESETHSSDPKLKILCLG